MPPPDPATAVQPAALESPAAAPPAGAAQAAPAPAATAVPVQQAASAQQAPGTTPAAAPTTPAAAPATPAATTPQSPAAPQAAGTPRSPSAPAAAGVAQPRPQPQPGPATGVGRTPIAAALVTREGPEGLRSWVAQLDRKLGLRTYVGLAVVILALATSVVAIVLAVDARDNSARNQDLNDLSGQASSAATAAQTAEDDVTALDARVQALEDQTGNDAAVAGANAGDLEKRLGVVESDIEELRSQISELQGNSSGSKP